MTQHYKEKKKMTVDQRLKAIKMPGGTSIVDVTRESKDGTRDYQEVAFIDNENKLEIDYNSGIKSKEIELIRNRHRVGMYKEFNIGDEVRAKVEIVEPDFKEKGETWTHAKRMQKGYVEDVSPEGYPTVRFYETNTATIVGKDEVSKTGKKARRKQSRNESYLDQADSSPMGGSMGPGKGWHGERMRHRDAALKRRNK